MHAILFITTSHLQHKRKGSHWNQELEYHSQLGQARVLGVLDAVRMLQAIIKIILRDLRPVGSPIKNFIHKTSRNREYQALCLVGVAFTGRPHSWSR